MKKEKNKQIFYQNMIGLLGENYYNVIVDITNYKDCYDIGFIYDKRLAQEQGMSEKDYILKLAKKYETNSKI